MAKDDIQIEVDDSLNDFLGEDGGDLTASNRVSFQLDTDGSVLGDVGEVEMEIEGEEEIKNEEIIIPDELKPESKPEEEEEPEEEKAEKQKKEKKRKSRAKERIKSLSDDKRTLENVIAKQNQEMEALRAEYNETTSTYAKVELERLTADVARLEVALKDAAENGDGEKIASITKQLIDSQGHIKHLQNVADKPSAQKPQPTVKPEQLTDNGMSDVAEDWMDGKEFLINNEEYASLDLSQRKKLSPVRQEMANVARQLLTEGFSNSDSIFYEEMDIRLASKFDFYEALALDGLDALEYNHSESDNTSDNDASGETEKPRTSNKSKNVPAKGPSRSSSSNLNSQSKDSNKVTITKEMHKYWQNHLEPNGISLKEYAIEIKKDQQREKF